MDEATKKSEQKAERPRVKISGSITVYFPSGSVTLRIDNLHASEVLGFFDIFRDYFAGVAERDE